MKGLNRALLFPVCLVLGLVFGGQVVFAEDELSITLSSNEVDMTLMPGSFGSETQTLTVSTTNSAGYTVEISTSGSSNALTNTSDSSLTIPTFTLPAGASSIPVANLSDGYGYSIDNGANYFPVPEPNTSTKLFKTTTSSTDSYSFTFGVKAPRTAVAGTYSNTVVFTVVGNLEPCPAGKICYYGNGDDGTGTMDNQDATSNTKISLMASNFSRPGYGFAGWNTEIDGGGTTYGPSQAINPGDLTTEGLQLYAHWIPSAGNLQNWQGCSALNVGDVTALRDTRDGNVYAVAKYADDNCWTMENLRLDLSDPDVEISTLNTNAPTSTFISLANAHPAPTNSFCANDGAVCDQIYYNVNNMNRSLTPAYNVDNTSSSWYSYGGYYNWFTATAGNGTASFNVAGAAVAGDICPAGWRLPTAYGSSGDYSKLDVLLGGTGGNQTDGNIGIRASERWRAYPQNYIYSGEQKENSAYNRGNSGGYNTASTSSRDRSTNFWIRDAGVSLASNSTVKNRGQTIRCVAHGVYAATGNIHYEANGGTGTMTDQVDVDLATAVAQANSFTKANAEFVSWNTKADGSGITVLAGNSVASAAEEMGVTDGGTLTLYAIWQSVYRLAYDGNGSDGGIMTVTHTNVPGNVVLVAPNFSNTGYGFAGWSLDQDAATKLANGTSVTVYGPNQTVAANSSFYPYADANNIIKLYATWLPADTTDTMQTFSASRCASMATGEMIALRDERDNNVYTVSKLIDGHCWMTENLRLDPSTTTFTSTNTNNPTQDFITAAGASSDSKTLCNTDDSGCIDQVLFNGNNLNRSLTANYQANTNSASWYSYGMMYGWYTATAGNGTYATDSGNVSGDICPFGWRLPTGGTGGEFATLANGFSTNMKEANLRLLSFPNNFIYSGDYNYNKAGGRSTYGRFYSSTPVDNNSAYRLGTTASGATPTGSWKKWDAFAVRCIVK